MVLILPMIVDLLESSQRQETGQASRGWISCNPSGGCVGTNFVFRPVSLLRMVNCPLCDIIKTTSITIFSFYNVEREESQKATIKLSPNFYLQYGILYSILVNRKKKYKLFSIKEMLHGYISIHNLSMLSELRTN